MNNINIKKIKTNIKLGKYRIIPKNMRYFFIRNSKKVYNKRYINYQTCKVKGGYL